MSQSGYRNKNRYAEGFWGQRIVKHGGRVGAFAPAHLDLSKFFARDFDGVDYALRRVIEYKTQDDIKLFSAAEKAMMDALCRRAGYEFVIAEGVGGSGDQRLGLLYGEGYRPIAVIKVSTCYQERDSIEGKLARVGRDLSIGNGLRFVEVYQLSARATRPDTRFFINLDREIGKPMPRQPGRKDWAGYWEFEAWLRSV